MPSSGPTGGTSHNEACGNTDRNVFVSTFTSAGARL